MASMLRRGHQPRAPDFSARGVRMSRPAPVLTALTPVTENYGWTVGMYTRPVAYKLRPRFVVPTPYRVGVTVSRSTRGDPAWFSSINVLEAPFGSIYNEAQNGAPWSKVGNLYNHVYSRFVGKMRGDGSELGAALAEYRKTVNFVEDRVSAISDYVDSIDNTRGRAARDRLISYRSRKYQRPDVLERFRRAAFREKWAVPRWLGARWLDAWMVIAPTIGDVNSSLQALGRDLPLGRIKASAKWTTRENTRRVASNMRYDASFTRDKWLRLSADVVIGNPNLFLLQTLGLLNPLVIAGQVTPWSWMVGWFVNWEQVLNSFTDFAGVRVSNPCISWSHRAEGLVDLSASGEYVCSRELYAKAYGRSTGTLPLPTLSVRLPSRLSISRAATSMSLIVNKLTNR